MISKHINNIYKSWTKVLEVEFFGKSAAQEILELESISDGNSGTHEEESRSIERIRTTSVTDQRRRERKKELVRGFKPRSRFEIRVTMVGFRMAVKQCRRTEHVF
ncbi:hypothetical protein HanXRQr2_Chr03g0126361 [Helianthus annuus]|uniref:Uncharacterized protein n=1 Tax=Helianthus annuus TaxID=4232 RepID=A0A251V9J4_HELAN|nr:hypothetical protein HanXRQr2_Chr03g0126361 [Helianthus annuus]KAJ0602253.1 hypothetical protein HanIR_Chr03g0137611 [Helianthus annuus]KAJ0944990.1 hypothetical protein HanPSC8_Chr03g0122981 [Helianthus annuus]